MSKTPGVSICRRRLERDRSPDSCKTAVTDSRHRVSVRILGTSTQRSQGSATQQIDQFVVQRRPVRCQQIRFIDQERSAARSCDSPARFPDE